MVFGLCAVHKEELLKLPQRATRKDKLSTELGTADSTHVSMRAEVNLQMDIEGKLPFLNHK